MVSNAMTTCGISAAVVALATFLGVFTAGIFEDTAAIFEQINNGQKVTIESVISDADMNRFKGIPAEVEAIQNESK